MDTADDPRPTYQWPTWRAALIALASARKGSRPRLARSPLYRTPGDRPPEFEDFVRLRAALVQLKIDDALLVQLTKVARKERPIGDIDTAYRRLDLGLRARGLVGQTTLQRKVSEALKVRTYAAPNGEGKRRSYYQHDKSTEALAPTSE